MKKIVVFISLLMFFTVTMVLLIGGIASSLDGHIPGGIFAIGAGGAAHIASWVLFYDFFKGDLL